MRAAFNAAPAARQGARPGARAGRCAGDGAGAGARGATRCGWRASPWRLGPAQAALHAALVEGIAGGGGDGLARAAWAQARRAASGWRCTVGHVDVLALPQGASAQSKITSESRP